MASTKTLQPNGSENIMVVDPTSTAGQVYSLAAQVASLRSNTNAPKAVGLVSNASPASIQQLSTDFSIALTRFVDGKILLVHLNLDPPRKKKQSVLETPDLFGWSELVDGECNYREVVRRTSAERLSVLNYGIPKRARKSATAASESDITVQSITNTLQLLKQEYEFIVFQLPSVDQDVTALSLASALDGVVVVIDHRGSRLSQVKSFVEFLTNHHVHVVGVVMNRYRSFLPSFFRRK